MSTRSALHCRYLKSDGKQCMANVQSESEYCFFHDPTRATDRTKARRAGGRERTRKLLLPADSPRAELKSVGEVVRLLGETINHVRRGELDLRVANCVGYLSCILLAALEKGQMEGRLTALEAIVRGQDLTQPADEDNYRFAFEAAVGREAEP